ncbi:MAG TPA: S8 family serine peptidase [Solirubrobacterales bacterium]|nr:S8 family serine peptidase [Solirubrobacterales bacterium]
MGRITNARTVRTQLLLALTLAALSIPGTAFAKGRVIVQWEPGTSHGERGAVRRRAGVRFEADLGNRRFQLVETAPGATTSTVAHDLASEPGVALAEPDSVNDTASIPNDPLFGQLWGLLNTGAGVHWQTATPGADITAPGAWLRTVGDPSVVVADLDSGYRFEHPDLAPVTWTNPAEIPGNGIDDDHDGVVDDVHGADFIGSNGQVPSIDGDPTDDDLITGGHGVHTAGTIGAAGNNGIGVTGVAQNARLMPLRVCSRFPGSEDNRCLTSAEVAAVNYAAAKGVRIVNMSFSGTGASQALVNAMAAATNTLFVTAAGNDRNDNDSGLGPTIGEPNRGAHYPCDFTPQSQASPPVPAAIDNVICVAATDQNDALAPFSDWGRESVDLGAPGTDILSTYPFPARFEDGFGPGFASSWVATGPSGGFELMNAAPFASYGITDRIGSPSPNTTRESTSPAFSIPPNAGCKFNQYGRVDLSSGDSYQVEFLFDGAPLETIKPTYTVEPGLEHRSFVLSSALETGGSVQFRLRFTTGGSPLPSSGVLLDEVSVTCAEPLGQSSGYGFLEGTSSAAAYVSGAAALLLSMQPSASVTQVREALLSSVDRNYELDQRTTTGGRLDVSKAVDVFDHMPPIAPSLTGTTPPSRSNYNHPRILGSAEESSTVEIFGTASCSGQAAGVGSAAELSSSGIEMTVPDDSTSHFSASAIDTAGNVSACSNSLEYVERTHVCRVPRLRGRPFRRARRALRDADCKLGKVRRPKRKKTPRSRLVVGSTKPRVGSHPPDDTVALRLVWKRATYRRH